MNAILETPDTTTGLQADMAATLNDLLNSYLDVLSEARGSQWSKHDEDLVRNVRDVLTRAGAPPELGHDVLAHLNYPLYSTN